MLEIDCDTRAHKKLLKVQTVLSWSYTDGCFFFLANNTTTTEWKKWELKERTRVESQQINLPTLLGLYCVDSLARYPWRHERSNNDVQLCTIRKFFQFSDSVKSISHSCCLFRAWVRDARATLWCRWSRRRWGHTHDERICKGWKNLIFIRKIKYCAVSRSLSRLFAHTVRASRHSDRARCRMLLAVSLLLHSFGSRTVCVVCFLHCALISDIGEYRKSQHDKTPPTCFA